MVPTVDRGLRLVDFWSIDTAGESPLDEVDVGSVDLAEELSRVRRQRLHVATLALGEDRVERERGLAGPGEPGEHDERVAWDLEVDVPEVVDASTPTLSVEVLCGAVPPGRWRSAGSPKAFRPEVEVPRSEVMVITVDCTKRHRHPSGSDGHPSASRANATPGALAGDPQACRFRAVVRPGLRADHGGVSAQLHPPRRPPVLPRSDVWTDGGPYERRGTGVLALDDGPQQRRPRGTDPRRLRARSGDLGPSGRQHVEREPRVRHDARHR